MSFEILAEKIGDNAEALEIVTKLKSEFDGTVKELKSYESRFNEAKTGRDEAKAKLRELADALGVDVTELNAETLKNKKGDDKSKAEIENLVKKMQELDGSYQSKLKEADMRYTDKVIEYEIAKAGLGANVVNDKALSLVIQALKDGATIEDGGIVYKDKDGSTLRTSTGKPMSIADRMAMFQADEANAFLFKPSVQGGGGGNPNTKGGGVAPKSLAEAKTPEERIAVIAARLERDKG